MSEKDTHVEKKSVSVIKFLIRIQSPNPVNQRGVNSIFWYLLLGMLSKKKVRDVKKTALFTIFDWKITL